MVNDPHAILLDEPAAGLNHGETEELKHHIVDLKSGDIAVVLIEHDMKLIMSISDEIYVMNRGSVLAHGSPVDIRNNQQVQEAYLGQPVQSVTSKPLLAIEQIESGYGRVKVLHGINLELYAGEIVSLIGPNGAGKSTLLRSISGVCPITSGQISFKSERIDRMKPYQIAKRGLGHCPEGARSSSTSPSKRT